jgi:hypothetical protein
MNIRTTVLHGFEEFMHVLSCSCMFTHGLLIKSNDSFSWFCMHHRDSFPRMESTVTVAVTTGPPAEPTTTCMDLCTTAASRQALLQCALHGDWESAAGTS